MSGLRIAYSGVLLGIACLACGGAGFAADFTYTTSIEPAVVHPDTTPPSMLCDGEYSNARKHAVQFNQHLRLNVDLGADKNVKSVILHAFQDRGQYVVGDYELLSSVDGKTWVSQAKVQNAQAEERVDAVGMTADVEFSARYLMLKIHKAPGMQRILLGELVVDIVE